MELTASAVRDWIVNISTGEFHYKQILGGSISPKLFIRLRGILRDLCEAKDPVVESVGRKDGYYRPIQEMVKPLTFDDITDNRCPITLPFDLTKYARIDYDTTIVVAGSKSGGKTGFIYRTAHLNIGVMPIVILSNMEGGKDRMKRRFMAMGVDLAREDWITIYPVYDNYHDYIREKNTLYLIDYIDVPDGESFWMIANDIKKVDQKLQGKNSVALIGLQKPYNRDIAIGGEGTLKVASLYLAMDNSKLKIIDAKEPSDAMKAKNDNPRGMQWTFLYKDEGTSFVNIVADYGGL